MNRYKPWSDPSESDEAEGVRLAERVEKWQERLELLGVAHWKIDRVTITNDMPNPGANASVEPMWRYDSCVFWFSDEFLAESTRETVDIAIIHEWLHVAMRDLDAAIESVEDQLLPQARELWEKRILHEREAMVEHLARQLYAFYKV